MYVPPRSLSPLGLGTLGPSPSLLLGIRVREVARSRGGRSSALEEHLHPRDDLLRRPEPAHRAASAAATAAVGRGLRGRRNQGYVGEGIL